MKVTFTKLKSGDWGLRIEGGTVREGQAVTVAKKDGTSDSKTVGKVLWTGNGVTLATISSDGSSYSFKSKKSSGSCRCGGRVTADTDGDCYHCGNPVR